MCQSSKLPWPPWPKYNPGSFTNLRSHISDAGWGYGEGDGSYDDGGRPTLALAVPAASAPSRRPTRQRNPASYKEPPGSEQSTHSSDESGDGY